MTTENTSTEETEPVVDPFNMLPPTRKNFATVRDALKHYEAGLSQAERAHKLLSRAVECCREIAMHGNGAANLLSQLTAAERLQLGIDQLIANAPAELARIVEPMIPPFEAASNAYEARANTIRVAVEALRSQLDRESSAHSG